MKRLLHILDYVEEGIIFVGLAAMTILNFANVVSRYFLHKSISYTEEVVIIIFLWVTMMGIAAGYKRNAHLGMSFVTDHLPEKGKIAAAILSGILSFVLILFLVYYGKEMVHNQMILKSKTTALRLPTYVQGLAIPVGGVFMGIRTIQNTITQVLKLKKEKGE